MSAARQAGRLATFTQMVFDSIPPQSDPQTALTLVRTALIGSPGNEDLRRITVDLFRSLQGEVPGFDVILARIGPGGGPSGAQCAQGAGLCLPLQPGDTLLSHMDDRVVEVTDIDREKGLFTLRREGRSTTIPATEVAREYERIAADDFRVLRQLRPEQLAELIQDDPVAVVIGLIRAHGEPDRRGPAQARAGAEVH